MSKDEERAREWREKNGSLFVVGSNQRTWHDSDVAAYAASEVAAENAKLQRKREHTWKWYAEHYAKLHDWARKILPEPHRTEFFNCVANGTWHHTKDVGERYMCKAGFEILPSGYIKFDDAQTQILFDQSCRAESAESRVTALQQQVEALREALERIHDPANPGNTTMCECEDHTHQDCCNSVDYYCPQCIAGAALSAKEDAQ